MDWLQTLLDNSTTPIPGSLFLPPNLLNIKCKLRWLSRKIAY